MQLVNIALLNYRTHQVMTWKWNGYKCY